MNRIKSPRCLQVIIYLLLGLGLSIYYMQAFQLIVVLSDPARVIVEEVLLATRKHQGWVGMLAIAAIAMLMYFMVADWITR